MLRYGREKCKHALVYRKDGYEEQCVAMVCALCGAFGCLCNADKTRFERPPWEEFKKRGLDGDANINGEWLNPYIKRGSSKEIKGG